MISSTMDIETSALLGAAKQEVAKVLSRVHERGVQKVHRTGTR